MDATSSPLLKRFLGQVPMTAELAELVFPARGQFSGGFGLEKLGAELPGWVEQVLENRLEHPEDQKRTLLVVASFPWWLHYSTALALLLAGLGHDVDLAYLPYRKWWIPVNTFDVRRQRVHLKRTLEPAKAVIRLHDLLALPARNLPQSLEDAMDSQSHTDVQYTRGRESIDPQADQDLYQLRQARNRQASSAALNLINKKKFDTVVIPNGTILEFGAIHKTADHLGLDTVTFEFGEQRERMWLALNDEVMSLDTAGLWEARGTVELTDSEKEELKGLYQARRGGKLWANFTRHWQTQESQGAAEARDQLNLDPDKSVALLCTNVVGDSLALGRQVFTEGMADWLAKTVQHFAEKTNAQLVVRVHPGELLGAGHPSTEIVRSVLPDLPEHVIVVPPESKINTYDLIELARVGLVYSTTVGMEMTMSGLPIIVSGRTHYRAKGFTHDPESLEEYLETIDQVLEGSESEKLSDSKIQLAWRYAHRFFFEYPFKFPWHLGSFWDDIEKRPLAVVLNRELYLDYAATYAALIGTPINWAETRVDAATEQMG
jgi:hypothetical protein